MESDVVKTGFLVAADKLWRVEFFGDKMTEFQISTIRLINFGYFFFELTGIGILILHIIFGEQFIVFTT